LDFFLSYHHADSKLAGKVRHELLLRNSTGFLAHEDIRISKTWREEILRNLRSCTALIAIITPNYAQSAYANQEAGYVLSKGKSVISFNFDAELPGFLESLQAIPVAESTIGNAVDRAIELIKNREPDTSIEPAFKTAQEAEDVAIGELLRHIKRQEGKVKIDSGDIEISQIKLSDETGLFALTGTASATEGQEGYISYRYHAWSWSMSIDARIGRILNKSVVKTVER
jgi:hypothetical protein